MRQQLSLWGDWTRKRPGEPAPVVRRNGGEIELVELHWGLKSNSPEYRPFINIRSEGRRFPSGRCLVPASEFLFSTRSGMRRVRWKFTLANGDPFYFAGIWRPASEDWPEAYAVLTTEANPEAAPYGQQLGRGVP